MFHASAVKAARKFVAAIHGVIPRVGGDWNKNGLAVQSAGWNGSGETPAIFEPLEQRRLMSVNVTTYHYSNAETGANTNETVLTPANVNTTTFGKLASMTVDGQMYAQPLVMTGVPMSNSSEGTHDIVLVATENDSVYAFDAYGNNPAQGYLWRVSLLQTGETTVPESNYGTTDITPQLGITGTPVIDASTKTMYLVGLFLESNGTYQQRLYALNITSGANASSPVIIAANVSGSTFSNSTYNNTGGVVSFSAFRENQRPALTLANGEIYIGWSSHGDQDPWHGWVMAYNKTTLHQDYVYCDTLNGEQGGIWMSGGGIAVDSSGNLYFTTGNGSFNGNAGSVGTAGLNFSMSLEKLSPTLGVIDYFAPSNEASLSNADLDFGCSNVILLTNQAGTDPNQVVSAGKWGTIYLNDSDTGSLGEFSTSSNADLGTSNITTNLSTSNVHQTIVSWNGYVYLAGDGLPLEAFSLANFSAGVVTPISSESGHDFGSTSIEDAQGGGLTVSANGTSNGILWALDNSGYNTTSATSYSSSTAAVLYAYNANNLAQPLWSSASAAGGRDTAGIAIKFQDPVVANGHVYIAGMNSITVYGLLSSSSNAPTITAAAVANPTSTRSTTNLTISATDVGGDAAPQYFWSASNAPAGATTPTFSVKNTSSASTSTATFYRAGNYTLTCTVEDPTTGYTVLSNVNVTVTQTVSGVSVSPSLATVSNSGTVQFTASAVDQFGNAMASQPGFTWSVTAGGAGGTINSSGLYTAPASGAGADTITATGGSISGSATATVAIPSSTFQINLTGYFNHFGIASSGSNHAIPAPGIDNSQDGLSGALLATASSWTSGVLQSWNGSSFTLGPTTTANNTNNVVDGAGQTISLSSGHYTAIKFLALHWDGSATDSFTLDYSDGTTQTVSQSFSDWFSPANFVGESEAVNMADRITSNGHNGGGPFYLYGYVFTPNYSKILTGITLPSDVQLDITSMDTLGTLVPTVTTAASAIPTTVTGTTTSLSAGGTDPPGDASPTFTWVASNLPSGAVVPTFSTNGTTTSNLSTATFHTAGSYTFTVYVTDPTTSFNVSSSVDVTVNQTLTTILENPNTARVYDGGATQFAATAYDQFGNFVTPQPTFTWAVKPGGAGGTVNSSNGAYAAPATGTGTDILNASSGAITGSATITVVNPFPVLTSAATVTPSPVAGTTALLTAQANDSAGDVKPIYTWATTNMPSGATTPLFTPNGTLASNVSTATFYQAGSYSFTVTITDLTSGDSISSSVSVIVNQTVTTVNVSPVGPVTIYNGRSEQFTAAAFDQFGHAIISPPPAFSWSVLSSGPGSVTATGLYQAPATGTGSATVQATAAGVNGTATVQVSQPAWLGAGSVASWNSSSDVLTVTGAATIVADPGSDQPIIQANGSAAAVSINPASALQIHIGGLNLTNGASAVVTSLGAARSITNHRVLVLGLPGAVTAPVLNIDGSSKLDLTDNDLVDHDGSLTAVTTLLQTGYSGGAGIWNGNGIVSSTASGATLTTLGDGQPASAGTFDNESVAPTDVDVRYTYYGDATLDGHVDGSDYSDIDNGFINHLAGFSNGDFNYDNAIDGSDYTLIDNTYNRQGTSLDDIIAAPSTQVAVPSPGVAKTPVSAQIGTTLSNAAAPNLGELPVVLRNLGLPTVATSPLAFEKTITQAVPMKSGAPIFRSAAKVSRNGKSAASFSNVEIQLADL